ncbi:archaeal proteasome endopeptidase complex subunit alpha [archaeon]|nr:archaeal proteasome endopeptidase complex subunit alpha [archaeon]
MMPVSASAYDRAITVFSPDGRLFQVEYAREAVKRGTTALGIVYSDGVLLGIEKNISSRLLKAESIEKIFKLDAHIAAATSGLVADARKLVDDARVKCQQERYTYNQPIMLETLARNVCDLKQAYTQYGGVRPFGAALLITGVDDTGKHLFETDPSGAMNEWHAAAIGSGKKEVETLMEARYSPNLSFDEAVLLALEALGQVGGKKDTPETVDVSFISEKDKSYTEISKEKLEEYFKRLKTSKK